MASPSSVLTLGLGSWGSPSDIITLGYGIGEAIDLIYGPGMWAAGEVQLPGWQEGEVQLPGFQEGVV